MHPRSWIWWQTLAPQKTGRPCNLYWVRKKTWVPNTKDKKPDGEGESTGLHVPLANGIHISPSCRKPEPNDLRFEDLTDRRKRSFDLPSYIKHIDWASCILTSWGLVTPRHRTHASSKVGTGYAKAMSIEHQPQDTTPENDLPGKGYFRIPGVL